MTRLATWLQAQMKERGLSQTALATRAGVALGTLNDILTKDHVPKVETLFRLADALDTSHLDILLITGHLRRADQLATGRAARPEVGNYLVQELLDELRRIPDEWKPQALAQLRTFSRPANPPAMRVVADEEMERECRS